jgi:hypothetical protein
MINDFSSSSSSDEPVIPVIKIRKTPRNALFSAKDLMLQIRSN